ncbi:MAG: thioredoxin domain-containing protein [Candidatus Thorarchaeota archaeon]|nr:MAG: thioredoxin domain-containing protein [Candidatus Thorarchaeota archaeon]
MSKGGSATTSGKHGKANRLIDEKSPYLLQHAYNPVEWYAWGDEAFNLAKKKDKPIFVSIGYSTCHWCHVMETESFEDDEVARLMNEAFVNIKVDREERPDIDKVYMSVAQMMTGRGGWPLTIIMTPDKIPFFAATYIPKDDRYGQLGMLSLVPRVQELWTSQREEIESTGVQIAASLGQVEQSGDSSELIVDDLAHGFNFLSDRFDIERGGFGSSPKFPTPHNLMFLLRHWKRTGDEYALRMVVKTLKEMRKGGIFDQVGFGFHRYSTDASWLLPHFEKMLYDQAMLIMAYSEAYHATGDKELGRVVEEVVTYVERDLMSPDGAFYSAEDADSEGVEGKFYVWTEKDIREALEDDEFEVFREVFNIRPTGNFHDEATGEQSESNIPHITRSLSASAKSLGYELERVEELVESSRLALLAQREKRVRPHLDDKILTDWNGLMIAALAKASRITGVERYLRLAERSLDFVLSTLREDGRLSHRYREGESDILAFLDDYAFLIWGLLELYETTFNLEYLKLAVALNDEMLEHFWDPEGKGLFFSGNLAEKLIARNKDAYDGAIPSGNSVAMFNLIRLARLLGRNEYEDRALEISRTFSATVRRAPGGFTMMLLAADFAIGPSYEIVIAGDPGSEDTRLMISTVRSVFLPNKVVLLRTGGEQSRHVTELASYTKFHEQVDGKATAHVCIDYNCKLPTTDASHMLNLLGITR